MAPYKDANAFMKNRLEAATKFIDISPYVNSIVSGQKAKSALMPIRGAATAQPPAVRQSGYDVAGQAANAIFGPAAPVEPTSPYAGLSKAMEMGARSRASGFRGTGPMKRQLQANAPLQPQQSDIDREFDRRRFLSTAGTALEERAIANEGLLARTEATQAGQNQRAAERNYLSTLTLAQRDKFHADKLSQELTVLGIKERQTVEADARRYGNEVASIGVRHLNEMNRLTALGQIVGTEQRKQYLDQKMTDEYNMAVAQGDIETANKIRLYNAEMKTKPTYMQGEEANVPEPGAAPASFAQVTQIASGQESMRPTLREADANQDGVTSQDEVDSYIDSIDNILTSNIDPRTGRPLTAEQLDFLNTRVKTLTGVSQRRSQRLAQQQGK